MKPYTIKWWALLTGMVIGAFIVGHYIVKTL